MDAAPINRPSYLPHVLRDRWRPIAELLGVIGLLEAELWDLRDRGPAWLVALTFGLIVLAAGFSCERRRRAGFVSVFRKVGAGRAWVEVSLACLVLSAVLVGSAPMVGDSNETFEFVFLDKGPAKLAIWIVGKFAAALIQQFALQLFLWPTCFELTRGRVSGAMLAASIFGLVHLPSPTLVAITFLAGMVWVGFYQRGGRLAPLVVSHMILATLAHGALPERLTYDMRVGSMATADMNRFEQLNDPKIRVINRRLKDNRASLKYYASEPYFQAQGGTLPGLIRGLFRDVLRREATDGDVAFWTGRKLANPQADMVNIFLASDEHAAIVEARKAARDGLPPRR